MNFQEILNLKVNSFDFDVEMTIHDYFRTLLVTLWREGEGFNGKRPFGSSAWGYALYVPLVEAGVVEGKLDEYGYIEDINQQKADKIIYDLINYIFDRAVE